MRLLIFESSFQRLAPQLSAIPGLTPVRCQPDGALLDGAGLPVEAEAAALEIAWPNSELYRSDCARAFMVHCLKSTTLRWLQSSAAGFDHPVFQMLVDKGVVLTNSHAAAVPIAEFVMAAVLDHYHRQCVRRALQGKRRWAPVPFREVSGTRWLIVGIGHIGTEVALRARAFGAEVVGVRRNPHGDEPATRVVTPAAIPEELPGADVIVLCAPANRESEGLVDARFLAAMKPGSVLVNVGRGSLVDERVLLAALDRGVPEHAVLDVFETEPLPQDSPLWSHPRVALSAHDAPNSDGFLVRNDRVFLDNLTRYIAGDALVGMVDLGRSPDPA